MNAERWFRVEHPPATAAWNMAFDHALLERAPELGRPLLRLYSWSERAGTFGYSQRYREVSAMTSLRPLIRRPTGGGLVPHDHDWTYSLVFPTGHAWYALRARESYRRLHEWVSRSLAAIGLDALLAPDPVPGGAGRCFAGAEQSDVLHDGRKIAGAAQRRTRTGLLIQGSIQPPRTGLQREQWQEAMYQQAAVAWGVAWDWCEPSPGFKERVNRLTGDVYETDAHNHRH